MPETVKLCSRCGQDCSTRPRIKDPKGRYTCRACLSADEQAALSAPAKAAAVPVAAVAAKPAPAPEPRAARPAPPVIEEPEGTEIAAPTCPSCQSSVPHGAALCVQCGYNLATGTRAATRKGTDDDDLPDRAPPRKKCPKCGYDLKGLKKPRCPECGTVITPRDREEIRKQTSKDIARWAYLKPVIQFVIGAAIIAGVCIGVGHPEMMITYAIKYAVFVPVGVLAFFLMCLLMIGFDAPMHLTALRLAGIYAVTDATGAVLSFLPIAGGLITLVVYIGLLMESLDMELGEAIIFGLVSFGLKIAIAATIIAAIVAANH
jgi:Double zinc ribbon